MNTKKLMEFIKKDLWILIIDVIAFNLSYYLALMIRFFVNGTFRPSVNYYITDWVHFAPYYTVIAILIFFCCKMYGGMWIYAGLNDMNRIILANVLTSLAMIIGTVVFVRRMPITYYVIGALIQFMITMLIRFSYRIFREEKKKLKRKKTVRMPAMIIGSGYLAEKVIKHLNEDSSYQPIVVVGENPGRMMDGIPMVSFEDLKKNIEKVQAVFIADKDITPEQRKTIRQDSENIEIFDYSGILSNMTGAVPLSALLEKISVPVSIMTGGNETRYQTGGEAVKALHTRYLITSVSGENLTIAVTEDDGLAYLKEYQAETGEEVSFF